MSVDPFIGLFLEKLRGLVEGEICRVLCVKQEIKKLQRTLTTVRGFLEDAEQKKLKSKTISNWVRRLKDVMYDADDIIDLCAFEGGKLLEARSSSSSSSSSSTVCFPSNLLSSCLVCTKYRHKIAKRIKEINDRLREIAQDNNVIPQLVVLDNQDPQSHHTVRSYIGTETSHAQLEEDIVGTQIEDDAQNLIELMLEPIEPNKQKYSIFGIVGMGGIGKTTLAQKIYNDKKIDRRFPTRIWLYVSKNYSETKLLKQLIREMGGSDGGAESKAELHSILTKIVSNKETILLVLDDLWSADVWTNLLRTPIANSGVISKILITTRDVNVAIDMGVMTDGHIHRVEKMSVRTGWELVRKIVFNGEDPTMNPDLKEVGIKIVEKCDGLPLAIKVMAGILLHKEKSKREWEKVLESDLWQMNPIDDYEIPRALYLSYVDLPSKLKPCFLSCSLFRGSTDYFDLVTLWMAEGFIVEQQKILMEELGDDYYKELVSRNLLQLDPTYVDGSFFVMHDLLRALATNLMEEGITLSEGETLTTINPLTKIRWLSISDDKRDILTLPSTIIEQKCLRALLVFNGHGIKTIKGGSLKMLRRLRVLDLSLTSIGSIPNSIGKLLHLRCLILDETDIREIPECIGNLMNLQTLSLRGCTTLHQLPQSISKLCNLRCLRLLLTPLRHVPKGIMELLTKMTHLDGFVIGSDDSTSSDDGCDLEELQCLSNLRHLLICRLERASIRDQGVPVLADQIFLRWLSIEWSEDVAASISDDDQEGIIKRAENVCSQLVPPSSLEKFSMFNFAGRQFPGWIMSASSSTSFPQLAYIIIENIPFCTMLPPLGQLPQLKFLRIEGALGIKKIGPEFLGSHDFDGFPVAFPKLTYLNFADMPNWEKWELCAEEQEEKVGDQRNHLKLFPNLTKCALHRCSRLIAVPEAFNHATKLKKLDFVNCERLERISNFPFLNELLIHECSCLKHADNIGILETLYVKCPQTYNSEFLPPWLLDLLTKYSHQHSPVNLRMICNLPLLKSCVKGMQNWHVLQQIPNVSIKTFDDMHWMWYTNDPPVYATRGVIDSE